MFQFREFSIANDRAALKVGTDAVLLGAAMSIPGTCRHALDIGTGTGVIALMLAQRCPGASIEAIDIDGPSAEEAADNFAASPWAERLDARHVALSDYTPARELDLIFSNPPYYDNSLLNPDARESTARHTQELHYRDIAAFAAEHLSAEGQLSLILPSECEKDLLRCAGSFGLHPFRLLHIRTTARKQPRRMIAEFRRGTGFTAEESELVLQDGAARTPEYNQLTKSFYL